MKKFIFSIFSIFMIVGCAHKIVINEKNPIHYTNVVRVSGGLDNVSSILKTSFKENTDEFYESKIGIEIQSEFIKVNSNFKLREIRISEVNDGYFKEKIGVKRERLSQTVLFYLRYGYRSFSPSATVNGKPASVIGDFSLIISGSDDLVEVTVSTQEIRAYDGYSCTLKEGFICGETASYLNQSPYEESLILNYVKFLLNKNGFKTF